MNILIGSASSVKLYLQLGQSLRDTALHSQCVQQGRCAELVSLMGKSSSGSAPGFQRFLSFKHKSQHKCPGLFETTMAPSEAR